MGHNWWCVCNKMKQSLPSLPAAVIFPLWCIHDILQFADPMSALRKGMNLCHQNRRCEFHATFQMYFSTSGVIEKGICFRLHTWFWFSAQSRQHNHLIWSERLRFSNIWLKKAGNGLSKYCMNVWRNYTCKKFQCKFKETKIQNGKIISLFFFYGNISLL